MPGGGVVEAALAAARFEVATGATGTGGASRRQPPEKATPRPTIQDANRPIQTWAARWTDVPRPSCPTVGFVGARGRGRRRCADGGIVDPIMVWRHSRTHPPARPSG